jgi:ketosteroid isomerase-like protein
MQNVREIAVERGEALARCDWEAVAAQLHPRFVYVNANGHRLGREDYLAYLADGPVRWNSQDLEDVEVVVSGSVAVLVATVVDDVTHDGEPARWEFVTTQTYLEEGGAWLYLVGHTALTAA